MLIFNEMMMMRSALF